MSTYRLISVMLVLSVMGWLVSCHSHESVSNRVLSQRPNIIYILADDLGYGEVGVYGQKIIQTPHIDQLAKEGMLFTQHYSAAPVCAPARCMLLTGKHAGHADIRGNDEWAERGDVWDFVKASADPSLEGQRPMASDEVTIAELLGDAGYCTSIFGKWGLGAPGSTSTPQAQGFDYFYGYNCQRQAHNLYPPHLWENDRKDLLNNAMVVPHHSVDSLLDPSDSQSYLPYFQPDYAPQKIHAKALQYLEQRRDSTFFMFYASPLPHVPLQVPQQYIDRYKEVIVEEGIYDGKVYFPCQYPRATYAAMITYLDSQVGELVAKLKALGIYENTLIIFSSDNGPTYTGGVDFEYFDSSAPFTNGYGHTKGYVYEGGIRVPMIASWPGRIQAHSTTDHISAFYDVLPTLCDVADIKVEVETDGLSFEHLLVGKEQAAHDYLYWEFPSYNGQQAVRSNQWKAVRKNIFEGNRKLELYDLSKDLKEQNDVADLYPEYIEQMERIMAAERIPSRNRRFELFKQKSKKK